jgi:hypothetical protein
VGLKVGKTRTGFDRDLPSRLIALWAEHAAAISQRLEEGGTI